MRRREFITLLGSAAVAWPSAGFAQTSFRVGLLSAPAPMTDNTPPGAALIRGFAQFGYSQGRNIVFERRGAEGHLDRLPHLVEELVAGPFLCKRRTLERDEIGMNRYRALV
jgi:putative ABC transport system substrate-binding protein